jgi:hypothetical protein
MAGREGTSTHRNTMTFGPNDTREMEFNYLQWVALDSYTQICYHNQADTFRKRVSSFTSTEGNNDFLLLSVK